MQNDRVLAEKNAILAMIREAKEKHVDLDTLPKSRFYDSPSAKADELLPHPVHMVDTSVSLMMAKINQRGGFTFYTLEKNADGNFIAKKNICINRKNNGSNTEIALSSLEAGIYSYAILKTNDQLELWFSDKNHVITSQGAETVICAGNLHLEKDGTIRLANDDTGAYYQKDLSLLEKTVATYTNAFTDMGLYHADGTGLVKELGFKRAEQKALSPEAKPHALNYGSPTPGSSASIAMSLHLASSTPDTEMRTLIAPSPTSSSASSASSPAISERDIQSPSLMSSSFSTPTSPSHSLFSSPATEARMLESKVSANAETTRSFLLDITHV